MYIHDDCFSGDMRSARNDCGGGGPAIRFRERTNTNKLKGFSYTFVHALGGVILVYDRLCGCLCGTLWLYSKLGHTEVL